MVRCFKQIAFRFSQLVAASYQIIIILTAVAGGEQIKANFQTVKDLGFNE